MVRPINTCLHPLFLSLIEIKYKVESIYSVYNGLTYVLSCSMIKTNRSHSWGENLGFIPIPLFDIDRPQPPFPLPFSYLYERRGLLTFFMSRNYLSIIITCSRTSRCLSSDVLSNPWNEPPCFWHWVDKLYHGVFSTDTKWAEAIIKPVLTPICILERSSLMSGWARLLQTRSLLDIQVALYPYFSQKSPLWGWLYLKIC